MKADKFIVGDRVWKAGQEGVIIKAPAGGRLIVRVLSADGTMSGATDWPDRGWTPLLGNGKSLRDCTVCGRAFRSDDNFASLCATCERKV